MTHEHWFDRAAERQTRARFLKSALAVAVSTLPLARSVPAQGGLARSLGCPGELDTAALNNNPYAWKAPCVYDANQRYLATETGCVGQFGHSGALATAVFSALAKYTPYLVPGEAMNQVALQQCIDRAILQRTSRLRNCALPDAPGFNPCQKGGPCETCTGICCPSSRSPTGFDCCTSRPGGCCKVDGCHSGITDCTAK